MGIFRGNAAKGAMKAAKNAYLKAKDSDPVSREGRSLKVRIALRSRALLDKAFVEGAKKTEIYQERMMKAIAQELEKPPAPRANPFQLVKTVNGEVFAYVPQSFVDEIFTLGGQYQTMQITAESAIETAQLIANRMYDDLGIEDSFEALGFLREEQTNGATTPDT